MVRQTVGQIFTVLEEHLIHTARMLQAVAPIQKLTSVTQNKYTLSRPIKYTVGLTVMAEKQAYVF